jgi:hypothetical protein
VQKLGTETAFFPAPVSGNIKDLKATNPGFIFFDFPRVGNVDFARLSR